jgi:hypothetical protein
MVLAVLCIASPAFAVGPNQNGTLVVHDTGVTFSAVADLPVPPVSTPPASCDAVDTNGPETTPALQSVWKVYAAFPVGASPRVKGIAWGISGTGPVYVTTAGLPDPPNCFQVVQGSWPSPPGSIGQSWVFTQTAPIVECYWFGGYCYNGALFSTAPHQTNESAFVDDATPGNVDPIAGFSSIGFGVNGVLVCPPAGPEEGACCFPDGTCQMVFQDACVLPGQWFGGDCQVITCPIVPTGACCLANEVCEIHTPAECAVLGGEYKGDGVACLPDNPCHINPTETTTWGQIKANYR